MLLTKLGHACVRLEKDGARLLIDPGIWAGPDALLDAAAVLVTHEHVDHVDDAAVRGALSADADLQLWASEAVAQQFSEFGDRVHAVHHGDALSIAGFEVHVYGAEHARVDSAIPVVPNTGFLVDGAVFHPGDSFTVPEQPVRTLLVPVSGPWLKFSDVADYLRAVSPERGYWIHDALLNDKAANLWQNLLGLVPAASGPATYLVPGTSVDAAPA
ncbi:MAG TPA: MBL fold metallo-hydrolase [Streptosporangiaceae bacterium]|nr:MBL fold metallo-hydrolase [Streptosporangiaceae bacterium]